MREECAREEAYGKRVMKRADIIWCKMPPREVQEAEQMTRAVGKGELTGNPDRETRRFPKAERPISETTSISQVIFVLVPEDISELIDYHTVSEHKRVM